MTDLNDLKKPPLLFLGLQAGKNYGWGVCSEYLISELSKLTPVHVLKETDGSHENSNLPGKLFQALTNVNLFALFEKARAKENYGYTFFENELTDLSLENARKYDLILAGSSWCRERLLEKSIYNSEVLLQGIDPKKFYPIRQRKPSDNFVIFSGGKFELRKGQDIVLRAFKILQDKYDDIILANCWYNLWPQSIQLMASSPHIQLPNCEMSSWEQYMNAVYKANGLTDGRIKTYELMPNYMLRSIYGCTDLGVFPNRCEGGTNLVMMEYMACAKPVIASNTSGHCDVLTDKNALLLNDLKDIHIGDSNKNLIARWQEPSLEELVCKIEYAYHHRDEIHRIGRKAGEDMKKFTWEHTAKRLLRIIGLDDDFNSQNLIGPRENAHHTDALLVLNSVSIDPDQPKYHYNLGNFYKEKGLNQQAIACYRRVVELDCNYAEAYFKLGVIENETGSADTATDFYHRAIELAPDMAEAWHNLGLIKKSKQDLDAAVCCFRKAIEIDPAFVEAYCNLGRVWRKKNHSQQALACFYRALEIKPDFCVAHVMLGELRQQNGEIEAALEHYLQALKIEPRSFQLHNKIGNIYKLEKKNSQALRHFKLAVELKPDFADAIFNLAYICEMSGDIEEAVDNYRKVLEIEPKSFETFYNIAGLMARSGRLEDAISYVQQAIRIKPDHAEAHSNLGNYYRARGQIDKAFQKYRKAIAINPSLALVHLNLSIALLLSGRYTEGWREYEWRTQVDGYKDDYRYLGSPLWDGKAFPGKRLLVHEDQGMGDSLQFVRYLPMIKKMGGTVIFEARRELTNLLKRFPGIDELVERPAEGRSNVEFDYYIPLLSVPARMGTQLSSIPADVPYLFADPYKSKFWGEKIKSCGFTIGFVWAGNKAHVNDVNRSCRLDQFVRLADFPQTSLFSLQKDSTSEEQEQLERMDATNLGPLLDDFSETAAVLDNLDLVITVDTAVAHLAAAMGKRTWILLPFDPDWRWMLERSDSPWYPTVRLFRQCRSGDWDGVMMKVREALMEQLPFNRHAFSANH